MSSSHMSRNMNGTLFADLSADGASPARQSRPASSSSTRRLAVSDNRAASGALEEPATTTITSCRRSLATSAHPLLRFTCRHRWPGRATQDRTRDTMESGGNVAKSRRKETTITRLHPRRHPAEDSSHRHVGPTPVITGEMIEKTIYKWDISQTSDLRCAFNLICGDLNEGFSPCRIGHHSCRRGCQRPRLYAK
jgi:hypothetical protein